MTVRWSDWAHVMFSTRGHWLPGDPRGFRNHEHRVHSSGDYKNPPAPGEHAALHTHARQLLVRSVFLTSAQQRIIAVSIAQKLVDSGYPPRILSVDRVHAHLLFRAGSDDAERIAGRAKQLASYRIRCELPGRIWGQHSHVVRIRDEDHYRNVVEYIAMHGSQHAAVWESRGYRESKTATERSEE